jgi:Nucleotidyltransferase domain.
MNEKIILKISRHIINYFYPDLSKVEILEKVYNKKYEDDECQLLLKSVENLRQPNNITSNYIMQMYLDLPKQKEKSDINFKELENLLKYMKKNTPIRVFKYILSKNLFLRFSFPMAILLFNRLYYKKNNCMVVIFLFTEPYLRRKSHINHAVFQDYFELILKANSKYEIKNRIYKIEEIQYKIKKFSCQLIHIYCIKKIFLFGSYVKGTNNCYSDIDFLFICDNIEGLSNLRLQTLFKKELEKVFLSSCDVHIHDNSKKYNEFEKNILKDSLLLFDIDNKIK